MRTFKLNKLVRDGVLKSMLSSGQKPETRQIEGVELRKFLVNKLIEEASEIDPESPTALKEIIDLREVADELAIVLGISADELNALQEETRQMAGGFSGHHFVGRLVIEDDDPWVEYYAAHPDRFPEVSHE